MNADEGESARTTLLQSGLEVRSRVVLEEGLTRIDARTRSRLNQARQAAVAAAARSSWLERLFAAGSRQVLMPATGAAAAAALVAFFVLSGGHQLTASVTDNPVVVGTLDQPRALSGANAVGAALGLNADSLGIAVAEMAAMAERRVDRLVNPLLSHLPAFLATQEGVG